MTDFTLVVGVDHKHLDQLRWTWPTWKKHKPGLLLMPMVVFFDRHELNAEQVRIVVDHPDLTLVEWPPFETTWDFNVPRGEEPSKWNDPQRYMMLSGFVHVAAWYVKTRYWLKIDTDTVAAGQPDWIDASWFDNCPAIVSHPWGFTKPGDQMLGLDWWVDQNKPDLPMLANADPLGLRPNPGSSRLRHHRIISWCAFFHTNLTRHCASWANRTTGPNSMPVRSQDGFMWYCAKRLGFDVERVNMKKRGWEHWSAMKNIVRRSEEEMNDQA
jgi:hypothetical protein